MVCPVRFPLRILAIERLSGVWVAGRFEAAVVDDAVCEGDEENGVFVEVIEKYFGEEWDGKTVELIGVR